MTRLRGLLPAAALVLLGGCKIMITVPPEGGRVSTLSYAFNCEPGATCSIDVVDYFFDQTFTVGVDAGYRFVGWDTGDRTLCGGQRDVCRVSTVEFSGGDALGYFLRSPDELFYLRPVFEPYSGLEGSGVGSAAACFSAQHYALGESSEARYRYTPTLFGQEGDRTVSRRVVGLGVLGDVQTVIVETETIDVRTGIRDVQTRSLIVDSSLPQVTDVGGEEVYVVPGEFIREREIELSPGIVAPLFLQPGESDVSFYTAFATEDDETSLLESVSTKTQFLGVETLVTEAGRFEACKFSAFILTSVGDQEPLNTEAFYWLDTETGLPVRREMPDGLWELRSLSRNGVRLTTAP